MGKKEWERENCNCNRRIQYCADLRNGKSQGVRDMCLRFRKNSETIRAGTNKFDDIMIYDLLVDKKEMGLGNN